jgi:hypothetical protein
MIDHLEVAARYAAAVDSADDDALRACHAPGARVWHNTDGVEQDLDANLRLGRWLRRRLPDVTFTEVRNLATQDGFVRLSVLRGTAPDGSAVAVPSCIVGFVTPDGLIERIEEYVDPSPLAALA